MAPRKLLVLLGALTACTEPTADIRVPRPTRPFDAAAALRGATREPLPASWARARRQVPPPDDGVDLMGALGAALTDVRYDLSLGDDLEDALAELPEEEVATYGAGALTLTELYGADYDGVGGVCEDPHALVDFAEGGQGWEMDLQLYGFEQVMEPVSTLWMSLSTTCAEAVDAAGGDVDTVSLALCSEEEKQGFFPEGGDCEACAASGERVADCQASGACKVETPQVYEYLGQWYEWAQTEVLACAPNRRAQLYLAAYDIGDDGSTPAHWDHTGWAWLCFVMRDERSGEIGRSCIADGDGYDDLGDGVGEGVIARIAYVREPGDTDTPQKDRVAYARSLSFDDGSATSEFLLSFGGIGQISAPFHPTDGDGDGDVDDDDWGTGYGGWGMNPMELRPDGSDPTELDDTYARDWLGAVVTKMSTTRNGVPINNMNSSRCLEWVGPHDDGSWTCVENGAPSLGWFTDNHVFWYNSGHTMVQVEQMMTLGSTGEADEDVPGGVAIHIAGTAALANPDWDDCAWPHQFVPDHIRTEDVPLDWGGVASLDADTYKFGKDPEQDLRMVLATPQMRGFCPEQ